MNASRRLRWSPIPGRYLVGAAATALLCVAAVSPATGEPPTANPADCAAIENDAERLACYDDAQRRPADAAAESADAPPQNVAIVVVAVRQRQGLNTLFTTAQGQTWAQVDFEQNYFPQPPFSAEIRPGRLGSFFLVPTRGTAVRVRLRD